jgi:anti-sigma B factor antagonist
MPTPLLTVQAEDEASVLTLRCVGELDISSRGVLTDAFEAALARRPSQLRLDLRGMTFIDSTGLGALIHARTTALEAQIPCEVIVAADSAVLRLLRLTASVERLNVTVDAETPSGEPGPAARTAEEISPGGPAA